MASLEYRLEGEASGTPALYAYRNLGGEELALRMVCDYLVKDHAVYETVATSAVDGVGVITVRRADDETAYPDGGVVPGWSGIRIELREFREEALFYPVIRTFETEDPLEALTLLLSTTLVADGKRWARTSAEVDEDRMVYVYYAQEVR